MSTSKIACAVILTAAIMSAANSQCTWVVQRGPDGFAPVCIDFVDSLHGWAGKTPNARDAMLRTTNGGRTWDTVNFSYNVGRIYSLSFIDSLRGWAVDAGRLHQTTDGGRTWNVLLDLSSDRVGFGYIRFVDSLHGFGVAPDTSYNFTRTLRTVDGGKSWSSLQIQNSSAFYNLQFIDSLRGWIVGPQIYHTSDGARTWRQQQFDSATVGELNWIHMADSTNGWCCAKLGGWIIHTTNGGKTWENQSKISFPQDPDPPSFGCIAFENELNGWVFGNVFYNHDSREIIYETADGGATWAQVSLDLASWLTYGYAIDHCHAWAVSFDGSILGLDRTTNVVRVTMTMPDMVSLNQNYPNPFNPSTTIRYTLPKRDRVSLVVHDELGRTIAKLVEGIQEAGEHLVMFDLRGLSSGTYFYTLRTSRQSITKKMLLIR